jgi:hypothetical protein
VSVPVRYGVAHLAVTSSLNNDNKRGRYGSDKTGARAKRVNEENNPTTMKMGGEGETT